MQVLLQFPSVFWDEAVDYFGAAPEGGPAARGRCSTFWNLRRWAGQPILIGLLSGLSADQVRVSTHLHGSSGVCHTAVVLAPRPGSIQTALGAIGRLAHLCALAAT